MSDLFWFTDAQWGRIEAFLPRNTRGMKRVDDRRVLSGIVHVLKSGGSTGAMLRQITGRRKVPLSKIPELFKCYLRIRL
jgi:transposase